MKKVPFIIWWQTSAFIIRRKVEGKAWLDLQGEKYLVSLPSQINIFFIFQSCLSFHRTMQIQAAVCVL
jgi:hypothetical protein